MTACSGLFLLFYKLFLEREKMFRFNRAYLLLALAFSSIIPFLTMELPQKQQAKTNIIVEEPIVQVLQTQTTENSLDYSMLYIIFYIVVAGFITLRSILNIYKITHLKGEIKFIRGIKTKIVQQPIQPFTFWKTLHLGSIDAEKGLDERIFKHEKAHIVQLHTLDILAVELFKIIFWFNPLVYAYRRLIKNNHEYLADEAVLTNHSNLPDYQKLILSEIEQDFSLEYSHTFFINNTKKRFIMMKATKSKFQWSKKLFIVPLAATAFVLFSEKTFAKAPKESSSKSTVESQIKTPTETISDVKKSFQTESIADTLPKKKMKPQEIKTNKTAVASSTSPITTGTTEMPEYPGGANEMRKKLAETFDVDQWGDGSGLFKSKITLVIDKSGNVKSISSEGDDALFNKLSKEAAEKALTTKWKPGTKDGETIESSISIPMMMNFEPQQINYVPSTKP